MNKIIGLIPSRLGSKRLPGKALAKISDMPVIIHVAKRAKLSNLLDNVVVCTDSEEIAKVCSEYEIEFAITATHFRNGTEVFLWLINMTVITSLIFKEMNL